MCNNYAITSELKKAIMNRSRLRNRYLKLRTCQSKIANTKQRNYTVNLLRKEKKIYYNELDLKNITDNNNFGEMSNLFDRIRSVKAVNLRL